MYGYIIAGIAGLALLVFIIAGLVQSKPGQGASRKVSGTGPVPANAPSADEPTPDRSVTADPQQIRRARDHTPPA